MKKPKPENPREQWVKHQPDGYVLRRLVPRTEREQWKCDKDGWWESEVTTVDVARAAAARLDPSYLIYAIRFDPGTDERMSALVRRDEL